jgi:hypothetical protein
MENPESKSKWDDLARELGAEISPETVQREEAVVQASQAETSTSRAREKSGELPATPLKRIEPGWDSLASDFGLPIPEPIAPAETARQESPREENRPAPRPPERDREETHARRPERQDRERKPRREQSEHRQEGRGRRGPRDHRRPRRDDRDSGPEYERKPDREREPDHAPLHDEEAVAEEPKTPREPPQKPAAVSLWHKIFGSPAEQETKLVESPGLEGAAPSDYRDEPRAAGSGFADAHPDEPIGFRDNTDDFDQSSGASLAIDKEESDDRKRGRPRRRRGRGRGRGRGSDDRTRDAESGDRRESPRAARPSHKTASEISDQSPLDDDDADDLAGESELDVDDENGVAANTGESKGARALQRAIPSWDEAIGFIVDSNMQSRSQRRPASRPGSHDNSRGRSRGRRRS